MEEFKNLQETKLTSQPIFDGDVLHIYKDTVRLPNGKTSTREYTVHHGAVCILPLLENGDVLLERQFRYAMGEVLTEIPAGKLDSVDEDRLLAAKRDDPMYEFGAQQIFLTLDPTDQSEDLGNDHIKAGKSMMVYELLGLDKVDNCVAVIQNADSAKYGKKDIIKIDDRIDIDLDVLGYIDSNITVNLVKDGQLLNLCKGLFITIQPVTHNVQSVHQPLGIRTKVCFSVSELHIIDPCQDCFFIYTIVDDLT